MQLDKIHRKLSSLVFTVLVIDFLGVNSRHTKQRCEDSEINVLSSRGAKIEPLSLSRVHMALSKTFSKDGHKMSFEFKTTWPSGLLFYGVRHNHANSVIALQMVNGRLFFTARCPEADIELLVPIKGFDDGHWHSVVFRRRGHRGLIEIDGRSYFRNYQVTCKLSAFVFGGIESHDSRLIRPFMRTNDHFDGCIRNVNLQGGLVGRPRYHAVSVCD